MAGYVQRNDPIERRNEVTDDIGSAQMHRQCKPAVQRCDSWREYEINALRRIVERLQRSKRIHHDTPQMLKNSERSAGLWSYSPRQNVVRVSGDTSRTPRICMHK